MKPTVLTLMLLVGLSSYGQKEEIKLEAFVSHCDALANSLVDKERTTDMTFWYEGAEKELAQRIIQQLENSIDNAPEAISHYLMVLNTNPLIFSLHFYETESKQEFGHMFIFFSDQSNNLIDDIQFVSKSYYDMNSMMLTKLMNAPNAVTRNESRD